MEATRVRKARSMVVAVTSEPPVSPEAMKSVKLFAMASDKNVLVLFDLIMQRMTSKRVDMSVLYLSCKLVDELFMRSKTFRDRLIHRLDQYLRFTIYCFPGSSVPFGFDLLMQESLNHLSKWSRNFGLHYPKLFHCCRFLKHVLELDFPDFHCKCIMPTDAKASLQMNIKNAPIETRILRFYLIQCTFWESVRDMECLATEMNRKLKQIGPASIQSLVKNVKPVDFVESEKEYLGSVDVQHGKYKARFWNHESDEKNVPGLDDLVKDIHVVIEKHVPSLQEWIDALSNIRPKDGKSRNDMLSKAKELKLQFLNMLGFLYPVDEDI